MLSDERKEYLKKYRKENSEKLKKHYINHYEKNKKLYKERSKKRYEENKENIKQYNKKYYEKNKTPPKEKIVKPPKEKIVKPPKEKIVKPPKDIKQYRKEYYQLNKDKFKGDNEKRNKRVRERLENDPLFKIRKNIRSLITMTIKNKGYRKNLKSEQILCCTFEQFKEHIENQFEPWMNWDNYGNPKDKIYAPNKTWDIDHIIPTSSGLTKEEIIKLNHYKNLKPLCSYVNRWVKRNN